MPDESAPAIVRTVAEAMTKAENMATTALDQFRWAEFMLAGEIEELLHIAKLRKAWLHKECNRINDAPVQQGHPLDGRA